MLTDAKARAAKPRAKSYKLTDSNRLFLLVAPGGGKLRRWNYAYDGKQKSMAFGAWPFVSLSDARSKRDEAYTILCEGRDPAIAKKLKIEANIEAGRQTFERVARAWHENVKAQWAKRHANDVMRSLERDVFPQIGNLPIAGLTPPLILAALREIEARGSIETAKRVLQRISCMFGFAVAEGIVATDPSERLGEALKPLRRGRQPAITDLVPLRQMMLAADARCGSLSILADTKAATAIEYGLIAALIAVAAIAAMQGLGSRLKTTFTNVSSNMKAS